MINRFPPKTLPYLARLHDLLVAAVIWYFAFLLRFNFEIPKSFNNTLLKSLPFILFIEVLAFNFFGLYRGMWRFASIPDLKRIVKAVGLSALVISFLSLIAQPQIIVPRSVLILNPLLLILVMGGSRFTYRAWKERRLFNPIADAGKPVIIIGVDEVAISLIKELNKNGEWRVVGIIDPYEKLAGRELMHLRVKGGLINIPKLAHKFDCHHCIIALPYAKHELRKQIIEAAKPVEGMEILTLPTMSDLVSGKISVSQIRKVDVEDLLGRDVVNLDNQGLKRLISSQSILISGAAGSIGSELCRQVLLFNPKKLVCIDISEYALYSLQQEFESLNLPIEIVYIVADVKNKSRISQILIQYQPKVVLHAAAYKHVPMMENNNVTEALLNNAFGTYQMASACQMAQVEKFVLISTDKAVNPTNVMGASKRLAELICQGLQAQGKSSTQFITVRFGNVLGSSGSVIPKFRTQIAAGGPITITHPEITRYFMSIPEAAQLVLQAGTMGNGGEIFVLDMGDPVKIIDLARDMIKLSGLHLEDIQIQFTGLRPGEKLYEELLADDENTLPTMHEKVRIAQARITSPNWLDDALTWLTKLPTLTELEIKSELKIWVEEYQQDMSSQHKTSSHGLHVTNTTIH